MNGKHVGEAELHNRSEAMLTQCERVIAASQTTDGHQLVAGESRTASSPCGRCDRELTLQLYPKHRRRRGARACARLRLMVRPILG